MWKFIGWLVSWILAALWWIADRLWGDKIFEWVKPLIPSVISDASAENIVTFGPLLLLILLGFCFIVRNLDNGHTHWKTRAKLLWHRCFGPPLCFLGHNGTLAHTRTSYGEEGGVTSVQYFRLSCTNVSKRPVQVTGGFLRSLTGKCETLNLRIDGVPVDEVEAIAPESNVSISVVFPSSGNEFKGTPINGTELDQFLREFAHLKFVLETVGRTYQFEYAGSQIKQQIDQLRGLGQPQPAPRQSVIRKADGLDAIEGTKTREKAKH